MEVKLVDGGMKIPRACVYLKDMGAYYYEGKVTIFDSWLRVENSDGVLFLPTCRISKVEVEGSKEAESMTQRR